MIDIHAHLCFSEYGENAEKVLAECRKRGMPAVIASSARYDEGLACLELAKKHPHFVFPSLGYHPVEGTKPHDVMELIRKNKDRIVAIGEVGLDHHWEKSPDKQESQKKIFLEFIGLAESLKLPLVIHSWDAEKECFEAVKGRNLKAVFHCFSGSPELAKEIVEKGFLISVSTQVIFSKQTRKIAKVVPLESMVLETDSPFLSPFGRHPEFKPAEGFEPKRNYPWNIFSSAGKIGEIKGVPAEEVLKVCGENALRFFGLKI